LRPYRHTALIGVGGNVGDVIGRLDKLYRYMMSRRDVSVVRTSPVLQNPPFGYADQADFFNAVMVVRTSMSPQRLLKMLLHTEKIYGRTRPFKNAPRTLDLDIIFYDTADFEQKNLIIPHPKWQERASVLLPLSKIQ
jgi:2-amino-4-hydroxy-6-hydroxymethyldihydropteridine diphosphokinase